MILNAITLAGQRFYPDMALREVFNCRRCGACCQGQGGIYIRPDDAVEIGRVLGLSADQFVRCYTEPRGERLALKTGPDGFCLMYDAEIRGCRIHEVKPVMCRAWPFYLAPLRDRHEFEIVKNNCPGIKREAGWEDFVAYYRAHQDALPLPSEIFK
ncbi:MAG: YkgJ family cysteine cluster protein [Deltaproteobacteria bacterium]|nr:YkgJ family cysteine cluster protein [Deltaproteobacteria bacterium]